MFEQPEREFYGRADTEREGKRADPDGASERKPDHGHDNLDRHAGGPDPNAGSPGGNEHQRVARARSQPRPDVES